MRCEIEECGNYQPSKIFIENTLAVKGTMISVNTQAAVFRNKFGVNKHDKELRKQQSMGLRLKNYFQTKTQKKNISLYTTDLILNLKTVCWW